jgi:hypothetical protein
MTDHQAEYAAFRADVLSRVLPMPSVPPKARPHHGDNSYAHYLLSRGETAKQIATDWLKWSKARDDAFMHGLKVKFPALYK